jgi:hypothetical protein
LEMDSNEALLELIRTLLNVDQLVLDRKDWDAAVSEIQSFRERVANNARSNEREQAFKMIYTAFDTMRGQIATRASVLHTLDTIKPYVLGDKGNRNE